MRAFPKRLRYHLKHGNRSYIYLIDIPQKGLKNIERVDTKLGNQNVYVTYEDSSIIYISCNVILGDEINAAKRFSSGIVYQERSPFQDTLINEGLYSGNYYWKECILGNVVIGYTDVEQKLKSKYDSTLNSFRLKKTH